MIEPILKALIQLFALISDVHDISEISSRGEGYCEIVSIASAE